jgi:inhibitor of cysteine peptidase
MHGACYADPDAQQSAWGVQAAEQQRLTLVDTRRYQPPARLLIRARSTRPTGCVASSRAIVMRAAFGRPPLWLILGTLLLLLSACETTGRGAELGKRQMSTITLTRADSGKVVETRAGDTLVVRLGENPTTGYQWAIETLNADEVVLQNVEYLRAGGAAVGGGGERRFTFKAQRAGTATVQLKLWRVWEGDASIVERFSVMFQVQE